MTVTAKQLANIRPPVKGEVRNPNGKPKGALTAKVIIRRWLQSRETITNPQSGQKEAGTVLDKMTLALIAKAVKGDVAAFNALLDRTDGKPPQFTEVSGPAGGPIPLTLIPATGCEPVKDEENE